MRCILALPLVFALACRGGGADDEPTDASDTDADTDTDTDLDAETGDTAVPVWVEEVFEAPDAKREDIVLIVDNSCSMSDNQANLAASMQGALDILDGAGIDWHIGVTSTDVDVNYGNPLEGRLVVTEGEVGVTSTTPDAAARLEEQIQLGVDGSGEEKGIAAAYVAYELRRDGANATFFRDDAGLHFVVLSDEQDQSDKMRPELITLPDFVAWLDALRGPNRSVSFSSIVCVPGGGGCLQIDHGTRYIEVSQEIGGIVASIHDPIDLSTQAVAAAIAAYAGLRTLVLEEVPDDPDAIEVVVDGVPLDPSAWSYDEDPNAVVLVDAAPDGAEVVVRWPEG